MKKNSKKQRYVCDNCGKEFIAYPKHRRAELKFCSVSCKAKYLRGGQFQKGESHPLWRGGLSNKQGYLWNWKYIKPKILKRDNYSCKLCSSKTKLEVHHIDGNKHNNTQYNLITLCKNCHSKTNQNRGKWKIFFLKIKAIPNVKERHYLLPTSP